MRNFVEEHAQRWGAAGLPALVMQQRSSERSPATARDADVRPVREQQLDEIVPFQSCSQLYQGLLVYTDLKTVLKVPQSAYFLSR